MRLALRFAAGVAAAALLVMAVHYWLQARDDAAMFEADHAQDMKVLQALDATLEALVENEGEDGARRVLRDANARAGDASFRFLVLNAKGYLEKLELPPDAQARVVAGEAVTLTQADSAGQMRRYTYLPVTVGGAVRGALELSRSMAVQETFHWRHRVNVLLTTLVLLTACTLVVLLLGFYALRRPLELLTQRAQLWASGDLQSRVGLRRHDEIGRLAQELDSMADRIVEERLRLAAETEERIATLEQLRHTDRLTTMGQLASGVAHELGTPLNVIAARAKMIESTAPREDEAAGNARIIEEQVARMSAIIRQLLDFARRRGPTLGVFNLRELVMRTLDLLRSMAEKAGVVIELEAPEEPLLARVDRLQMQQALANVIMNGIQAMPKGGRLAVRLDTRHARPRGEPEASEGEYVSIAVQDQGVGIPREYLGQIFEPFFTTKGVGEGTGLGLSVAYGIVREHGGWIEVESEAGRGTRFTICLQRAAGTGERAVDAAS